MHMLIQVTHKNKPVWVDRRLFRHNSKEIQMIKTARRGRLQNWPRLWEQTWKAATGDEWEKRMEGGKKVRGITEVPSLISDCKGGRKKTREGKNDRRADSHPCLLSSFSSGLKETPLHSQTGPPACSECRSCSRGKETDRLLQCLKFSPPFLMFTYQNLTGISFYPDSWGFTFTLVLLFSLTFRSTLWHKHFLQSPERSFVCRPWSQIWSSVAVCEKQAHFQLTEELSATDSRFQMDPESAGPMKVVIGAGFNRLWRFTHRWTAAQTCWSSCWC